MKEDLCTLPPGIDGTHVGTLTISFRHCSVPNVVAHIKFWGGIGVNLFSTSSIGERSMIATSNSSITFTLVGSTIATYLRDASPLHIKILTKDSALIGNVFIPDLSLPPIWQDFKRSSKGVISLGQTIIGDATFDLHFRLMPAQTQQPNLQQLDDFQVNQLLEQANGSEYNSELCDSGSIAQEKYSLISELLDICTDDMTIPTVDTSIVAATGVDPYDSWISNIISSAASPPRTSIQSDETVTACEQPTETAAAATATAGAAAATEEDTFPHPISLFLSNVAIAANAMQLHSSSISTAQAEARVKRIPSTAVPPKLEPMQPPPIWIDIGVSNLRISAIGIGSPPSSIELSLKCNEPLISLCDLVQSSAFGGHESSSKYSSKNVKIVEMPNECKELVSLPTQLSWQAGLKTLNDDIEVTLQLRYYSNGEKMIAHVSIPFQEQILKSSDTLGLLPRFQANGWYDILDPNNSVPVGRIQLSLASGTLKQIRSLPKAHKCAAAIQRYWRKTRSIRSCCAAVVGKRSKEPQSDEDEELSERLRTQNSLQNKGGNGLQKEEGDDDSHLPPPPPPPDNSDDVSSKQIQMQAESSPDSLLFEWTQQSFLHIGANEHAIRNENSARATENDVGQTVDTLIVKTTNVDTGVREVMDEKGTERNVTFNTGPTMDNDVASDAEELQDPFPSSQDQSDSHEDDSTSRRRQPIDPPEEYDAPTMKRKIDQTTSFSVPDAKRHRHSNNSQSERDVSSLSNLEAGAIDMSLYEEDSSGEDYRSLQSVMKSLADVEERLKLNNSLKTSSTSALGCQNDAPISVDASVAVDDRSNLTPLTTGSEKSSQLQSSPLEKECSTNTETAAVETCEKGTSPLCIPSQCKDASTSPYEERGRFEKQGRDGEEEDEGDVVNKEVQDKETKECVFTPKNDDKSTLQLDWSLKKMTHNHSNQGLFPTFTTSDRRERYGSLFNSHGALRLSSRSLLSPTTSSGAPRLEGTRVDSSASGYRRYLSGRGNPRYEGVSSRASSFNFTSANSDRIEQIFSGSKKKKDD